MEKNIIIDQCTLCHRFTKLYLFGKMYFCIDCSRQLDPEAFFYTAEELKNEI